MQLPHVEQPGLPVHTLWRTAGRRLTPCVVGACGAGVLQGER